MLSLRRWFLALAVVAIGAAAVEAVAWRRLAVRELAVRAAALAADVEAARRISDEATGLIAAGRYDLLAQVSRELVARALAEFEGYSQLTRRGNRFAITALETRFAPGHAEVLAHADFDWRFGLYDGPIVVRYVVFADLGPDNVCVLHFRVAEVRTLARWRIFNRLLAPILTLRMQDRLAIRDLPLPLGLRAPLGTGLPGMPVRERRPLGHAGLRITVPPRAWDLGGRRVLPVFDAARLGLLVASRPGAAPDAGAGALAAPPEGVDLAVRLGFLSELLSSAVRGPSDIQIAVDSLPRLWQNQGRLFGVDFDNHLDLLNVAGVIDIVGCRTTLAGQELGLELELSGRFAGTADARLFGVSFSLPFKVRPAEHQLLPLRLVAGEDGVALALGPHAMSVPLEVETSVARMAMRGSYPLSIPPEVLDRVLTLPGLRVVRVELPSVVESGRAVASRRVPLRVLWRLALPENVDGFARAHGDLQFEDGGDG